MATAAAVPAGKALSGPTMTMNRMQMREMVLLRSEMVVRKWIESVLNITIPPSDFLQHLGDGVILCRLMQTLLPNYRIVFKDNTKEKEEDRRTQQLRKSLSLNAAAAIEKEDDSSDTESDDASTGVQPLMHGQRLKNIQTFLAVCTKIRLEESFAAPDLMGPIYNKDRVLQCLLGIKERGNDVETPPTVSRKTTMNRTVTAPPSSTTTTTATSTSTSTSTATATASSSATTTTGSGGGNEGVKESSGGDLSSAPGGGSVAEGQQGKAAEEPAQTQGQEGGQQVEEAAVMVSAGSSDKAAAAAAPAAAESSPGGSADGATGGGVAVVAAAGATAGAVVLVAAGTTTTAAGDVESSKDSKEAEEETKAATKIQAGFRGYQVRQEIKAQDEAATKIQASFRGHKTRKELGGESANSNEGGDAAAAPLDDTAGASPATTGPADQKPPSETVTVVSGTGASESTTPGGSDATTAAASDAGGDASDTAAPTTSTPAEPAAGTAGAGADGDAEAKAATKIQAGFRGYQVRQEIKAQDEAATKIQASFRGHKTRKELESTSVDGQAAAGPTATATAEGASGGLDPTATSSGSTGAAEPGVAPADASTAPSAAAAAAAAADANTDANGASATTTATAAGASTGDAPPTESGGAGDAGSGSSSPAPAVAVAAVAGAAVGGAVLVGAAASAGSEAGPTAGDDEASSGGKAKGKKAKGGDDDEDGDGEGGGGGADLDATLEKLSQSMTLVKSGSLLKRGTKAQTKKVVWKMRQFVLTDAALVYGDLKSGQSPKGALKVSDMAVCRITQAERDNCIEIVTRTKSFFLGAASREEANEWMAAVNSLLPTPDFPADPVECWLTWRRAFEDDYFPTFFKFKRGNRGTNYRFAELCGAGVSSLSDIILPPFSITRNGADCTINVRDDVHGRIGFIILVKMQEGEGWQIVSEDWKAADAAMSGKKADEDDDDEDDGEGEGEGDGETVDASDSTTNLAPGEKGKDEAGSSSAQAAGAATTTVSPAASSAGPAAGGAAGGAAAAGAVVAGGAVAVAGAGAVSSGAASSTGAAGSDGSSAAGGSSMSAADIARSASISRAAALDSATQPRGYQVYATETKIKEGVLQKRGGERKVWHARQITLTSTKLVYAATGKNGKVKGEILVSDMECAAINTTEKKKKYCFELVSRERTYYFEAASQNELNEWLAAFDRLLEVPNFEAADWSCWKLWRAAFENNYLPTIARFRAPGMQSKFTFAELIQCGVPRLGDLALPPAKIDKSSTEVHIITVESKQGGHIGKITVTARGGGKAGWLVAGEEWSNDPSKADGSGASGSGTASSSATTATGTGTSSDKGKDPASAGAGAGAGGGEDGAEEGSDEDGGEFIRTGAISATPAAGEVEVKSGVLSKRGGSRKNWNTRQIVLSNVKLTYAAVGKGKPIKGSIPVADMVYAIPNTSEKKKFCLELITRSRRYYMFAKKQEEIDGWFQAFAEVLKVPAFSTDPYECWRLWRTAFETNYAPTQYVFKRDKDGFVYADFPVDSDVPRVANVTLLATMTSGNAAHLSLEAPGGFNGTVALEQLPGTPGWLVLGEDWTKVEPTIEAGPSAGTATTGAAAGSEGEASATSATASPAAQPEESPAT